MARERELPSQRVERELRAMIAGMPPGAQLPATAPLAVQLGTSKATLRRVLARLAEEGLVEIVNGWGTFVS
jgi:DNA-binding FadR family transcriptional regulator